VRKQYIEQAAELIGVDPQEVTPAHAYRILKDLVLDEGDFTIIKAKKAKKTGK
jgi:hypothetical protein